MSNLFSQLNGFNSNQIKQLADFDYDEKCDRDYSLGTDIIPEIDDPSVNFEDSITLFAKNDNKEYEFSFDDEEDIGGFDIEG